MLGGMRSQVVEKMVLDRHALDFHDFDKRFGEGLFLFYGDVAKLCRVKDFPALLTFNKLCVFLSGDDLDDGMFALGYHLGRNS